MSTAQVQRRASVGVIDIFAGPGGLGEGFCCFESKRHPGHPFEVFASVEMEWSAYTTLRLRTFYQMLVREVGNVPKEYRAFLTTWMSQRTLDPADYFRASRWHKQWAESERTALNLTLGKSRDNESLFERIRSAKRRYDEMILIGGPPCQAYSLVGRARQKNVRGFRTAGDARHFLYKQYLAILTEFKPAVFIMENVKGILTSRVGGLDMFPAILADLSDPAAAIGLASQRFRPRYTLLPIHVPPNSTRDRADVALHAGRFVIHCERHGAPQARHRVIIMGVRADCMRPSVLRIPGLPIADLPMCAGQALDGLPPLRSGLSRSKDDAEQWRKEVDAQRKNVVRATVKRYPEVARILHDLDPKFSLPRCSAGANGHAVTSVLRSRNDQHLMALNHETRGHMPSDLGRYLFCAAFGAVHSRSPTQAEFPDVLAPDHENWETGAFADRFRVQIPSRPASTITSHLSKDGHAFIHWDPAQCRSLTVREAARLQTFPDDYLFLGNRTQQFVQVGNAVPPAIARHIARVVHDVLHES